MLPFQARQATQVQPRYPTLRCAEPALLHRLIAAASCLLPGSAKPSQPCLLCPDDNNSSNQVLKLTEIKYNESVK